MGDDSFQTTKSPTSFSIESSFTQNQSLSRHDFERLIYEQEIALGKVEQENLVLKSENSKILARLKIAEDNLQEAQADKKFLYDQQKEKSSIITKLQAELNNLNSSKSNDLTTCQSKLVTLNMELLEAQSTLKNTKFELVQSAQERENIEIEYKKMKQLYDSETYHLKCQIENLKQEIQSQVASQPIKERVGDAEEVDILRKIQKEQNSKITQLQSSNNNYIQQLNHFKKKVQESSLSEEKLSTAVQRVNALQRTNEELIQKISECEALKFKFDSWESFIDELRSNEALSSIIIDSDARAVAQTIMKKLSIINTMSECIQDQKRASEDLVRQLEISQAELKNLKKLQAVELAQRQRIEAQKNSLQQEIEFLRKTLKSYEVEADKGSISSNTIRDAQSQQIEKLQNTVDEYQQKLNDLSILGQKRPADDHDREVSHTEQTLPKLHRTLQLKNNPTSVQEKFEYEKLELLEKENDALRKQISAKFNSNENSGGQLPPESFKVLELKVESLESELKQREKRILRLKTIWAEKADEMREAIYSLLGWKMDFLKNGRVRVTSMYTKTTNQAIEFDGESSTMQLLRGNEEMFPETLQVLIRYWCDERKTIPGMLAAMTLEYLEQSEQNM